MNNIQKINCPKCGKSIVATSRVCLYCKSDLTEYEQLSKIEEQLAKQNTQSQQASLVQPQQTNHIQQQPVNNYNPSGNPNMMQCPACGNSMSKLADKCPFCGNPRPKKIANPLLLDILAIISIIIAIVCDAVGNYLVSYGIMLLLLIIYWVYYSNIKSNPDIDSSKVKQSLNVITILFILMFCIGFVFIF